MAEMIINPDVRAKAQAEIRHTLKGKKMVEEGDVLTLKYLKLVNKETFRLHPPIPLLPKACREEIRVDGYTIPLKSKDLVNIWGMGGDPAYWDDPISFKPQRFEINSTDFMGNNFEYLLFREGKRICPGMILANLELPLAQFLYHFDWKLPKGEGITDTDMTEANRIAVSMKKSLSSYPHPTLLPPWQINNPRIIRLNLVSRFMLQMMK